ncbi:dihydropteroate synthase [Alteromonas sediminis]|uniref:Dihydropteroate synthase n=2 Tax=Alteromonas sediminis TaxID=2259342 RepID=A0A3N5YB11_9ALTE|nr:dihydropteroate synthase [Alteromonas sediminis]
MAIVNVTPDSFSDGGQFDSVQEAVERALRYVEEGADWLDIGGESTRPGAAAVDVNEELERVIPVIEGIRQHSSVPISIDTSKAQVMQAAVESGATMINDVCALQQPGALDVAAKLQVPICLMHMQGTPRTMQQNPHYNNVVEDVLHFLDTRKQACIEAGIALDDILFDPGYGFGKSVSHNYSLVAGIASLAATGHKVLVGMSRKSMIGAVTGRPVEDRLAGSIVLATLAMQNGAHILRVHDVKETVDAVKIFQTYQQYAN